MLIGLVQLCQAGLLRHRQIIDQAMLQMTALHVPVGGGVVVLRVQASVRA